MKVMTKTGMVLDFLRSVVRMKGATIKLKNTTSGHYAMPLSLLLVKRPKDIVLMAWIDGINDRKMACTLHRQFSHPNSKVLKRII